MKKVNLHLTHWVEEFEQPLCTYNLITSTIKVEGK